MKKSLTKTEQRYLDLLLTNKKGVSIEDFLAGNPAVSGRNLVAAHIVQLRRKVAAEYEIEAISGWGYQLFTAEK